MKEKLRKPLWAMGIAGGIAVLLTAAFVAGRMHPFERASAAGQDFKVVDGTGTQSSPSMLPGSTAWNWPGSQDPFETMKEMQKQMDAVFNRAFSSFAGSARPNLNFGGLGNVPDMDLRDEGDSYVARLDMPGLETGSLDVKVQDNQLTISGTRVEESENNGGSVLRHERHTGSFTRSTTLPEAVDAASVHTQYKDGVLTVRISKSK